MKLRKGFVGNSSSSSFAIIGKRVNYELEKAIQIVKDTDAELWFEGDWAGEGKDIFELGPEMIRAIQAAPNRFKGDVYLVYQKVWDGDKIGNVDPEACIYMWEVDNCTTDNLLDFLERYLA